jgi:amino acid transporter
VESAAVPAGAPAKQETSEHGLKANAIGFIDGLVIGLASTAPAYSLAAVIGSIVVAVGVQAPAVLALSFIPMFLTAAAFYFMNKVDPDCGTTFSWVTRALGPYAGWIAGWAVCTTGLIVVGSLADIAAYYTFDILSWEAARDSKTAVMVLTVSFVVVLTAVCVIGTELSARLQRVLILAQVGALILFAVVAIVKIADGQGAADPELSWFSPFAVDEYSGLLTGLLLGVFIYWGWESAVNLTEETEGSTENPGRAGLWSTIILVGTYLAVAVAVVGFAGVATVTEFDDDEGILGTVAEDVLGGLSFLVVLAIITSGLASTQTTILPASRTILSMARSRAFPEVFGRVHPRFLTPHISTISVGALAIVWYVGGRLVSDNFLFDTLAALSLMIAFYYAFSGIACAVYYRRELSKSAKNLLFMGIAPLAGAAMLIYLFIESARQLSDPGESDTGTELLGVGVPLFVAVVLILVGFVLMLLWRFAGSGHEQFFKRKPFEALPPDGSTPTTATVTEGVS